MTKQSWAVSHGLNKDGTNRFSLHLEEKNWWVDPWDAFWDTTCWLSRHKLCGSGLKHDIWWRISIGKAKWDPDFPKGSEDEYLTNSIGASLYSFFIWTCNFSHKHGVKHIEHVPITEELGISLWPDPSTAWLWDGSDPDDEDDTTE